ncbi:MAG: hypothetical protein AAF357_02635, partial [Verrucomicrobiota bacterium]
MTIKKPEIGPFFERLLIYLMLGDFIIRIVFEFALGMQPRSLTQHRQFFFYGLVAFDYLGMLLCWVAMGNRRVELRVNWLNPLAVVLGLMILQGILVGLYMENSFRRILIDTTSVAVLLINLLLFANPRTFQKVNFQRLERFAYIYSFLMISMGFFMQFVHGASNAVSLGNTPAAATAFALMLSGILISDNRKGEALRLSLFVVILCLILPFSNRTTVAAVCVIFLLYLVRRAHRPVQVIATVSILGLGLLVTIVSLPEDSKIARGVQGIINYDNTERTGSIGERHAEADAITAKIKSQGSFAVAVGLGHGAAYD